MLRITVRRERFRSAPRTSREREGRGSGHDRGGPGESACGGRGACLNFTAKPYRRNDIRSPYVLPECAELRSGVATSPLLDRIIKSG